jgi:hypothetical protein
MSPFTITVVLVLVILFIVISLIPLLPGQTEMDASRRSHKTRPKATH